MYIDHASRRNPSFKILIAAFRSRSCVCPHTGHVHSLTERSFVPLHRPWQLQQSCEEGKNLSITTTFLPYHFALYSSCLRNSLQLASCMDLASLWFFTIFFGAKSSIQMMSFSLSSCAESLWSISLRWFEICSCSRAICKRALSLLRLPFAFRESCRCSLASFFSLFARYLWFS